MTDSDMEEQPAIRRTAAIAGLAATGLIFSGQGLIQVGGGEPAFDAPTGDIVRFFATRSQTLFPLGNYLVILGLMAMLWFFGGLYAVIRRDWRSVIALISGTAFVAMVSVGGWELASFRQADGVDPQIARLAFDMGNLAFATGWVALGSFAIAAGWSLLALRQLPAWLGWLAIAAGVCLIAARAVWNSPLYLAGYLPFWIWVVAVSVVLLRSGPRTESGAAHQK